MCFADDLFLFSHGDRGSVEILGEGLKHYALVVRLQANDSKSYTYFARVQGPIKE